MDGTLFGESSPIYAEWMMYNDFYDWLKATYPEDTKSRSEAEAPVKNIALVGKRQQLQLNKSMTLLIVLKKPGSRKILKSVMLK